MGFTPAEGLMMGTRSGDLDPGVIFYLHRQLGFSVDRIDDLVNRESGLFGVSGTSNDMRDIIEKANQGNERCTLAIEMYAYRLKKCIAAYAAALGGPDALVFTAGVGENSWIIRRKICEGLEFLGVHLDGMKNQEVSGTEALISTQDSRVQVLVIPTNEEQMIALDTINVVSLKV
jgi:acetate kinase